MPSNPLNINHGIFTFVIITQACAEHRLDSVDLHVRPGFGVSVILASEGYPGSYAKGKHIVIGDVPQGKTLRATLILMLTLLFREDVVVFHAGTALSGKDVVTSGGRVLAVSAYALTLREALDKAYAAVERISFEGKTYRKDIGHR